MDDKRCGLLNLESKLQGWIWMVMLTASLLLPLALLELVEMTRGWMGKWKGNRETKKME
ncbi:hypothetical protein RchiOBHm_Chr2g0156961 [Rosa chinensis]|uniref:Uncharacterized protein n=1 Tax=Rosa chinensis TaxID=74649 RepID=A0A2P6P702_ROSCH|nr:hypothetical protein RchiOBHm_Chr7g0198041 [Rosa chinensis]PRQ52572.1 hypothetical protein RchiOBHm_Chr2g0156961 [Rosa chinensis]